MYVPPLRAYRVVGYRRSTRPAQRVYAAFRILKPDASGNRSFDAPRRLRDVAGWLRHATGQACAGWPFGDIAGFVHGHDAAGQPLKGERADERFLYLPLPTHNSTLNRFESIGRVLLAAPAECADRLAWARRRLMGADLTSTDGEVMGLLNLLPNSDWVLKQYTTAATDWSTVTPVIWPGHDDRCRAKAARILRKAFVDAGLSREVVDGIEELEWRPVAFRAGVEPATRYCRPDNLCGRMYHVRVRFAQPIPGPLAVGAGRYRGLGLFAAEPSGST